MLMLKFCKGWLALFTSCLLLMLAACSPSISSSSPPPSQAAQPTNANTTETSTKTTEPVPPTETNCPAAGTARAWVKAPLALGTHSTIVYDATNHTGTANNTGAPLNTTLKRYDTATSTKTDIISIPTSTLQEEQISADKQWILFTQLANDQQGSLREKKLQVVRMDGQGLQTLYCTTSKLEDFTNVQWSPDQQSIAFNQVSSDTTPSAPRSVKILHTTSGQLQNVFSENTEVDEHGIDSAFTFDFWADTTHLYIHKNSAYLIKSIYMLDMTKGDNQKKQDLSSIVDGTFREYIKNSTKLYVTSNGCDPGQCAPPSTIVALPATGGTGQTIWQSNQYAVTGTCPISDHQFLVTINNFQQSNGPTDTSHNGVWIMNLDGTLAQQLSPAQAVRASFTCSSDGSGASPDGSMYSINVLSDLNGNGQLLVGKIAGGDPTPFAPYGGGISASIVGWTAL